MKKSTFTETQIVNMIREYEGGRDAAEICREHSISGQPSTIGERSTAAWNPMS